MNNSISVVEAYLAAGDVVTASDEFAMLRPGLKSGLEGLKLSTRIHSAANRWEQVDVLCRVLRKEYPNDVFGFTQGAESLHQQGRNSEAVDLLKEWLTVTPDQDALVKIEQYRTATTSS